MQLGLFHYITLLLVSPSLVISQYVDHENFHPNSNPLFMGISFAVATILVVVIFIVLNICCRQHIQARVRADDGLGKRAEIGLDPSVLKTFPVFKYSAVEGQRADTGPLECAVCLSPFEVDDDEELRLLPKCSHIFHVGCVDPWLKHHTTCPLCRTDLVPESDKSTQPNPGQVPELGRREEGVEVNDSDVVLGLTGLRGDVEEGQFGKLKRWKSTGHVAEGECWKRFTLNLPEEKMKKLGEEYGKLQRSRSS